MAQNQLWYHHRFYRLVAVTLFSLFTSLLTTACEEEDKPIGMSLLFQSAGRTVGVGRFDPDGMRGPVPGSVGGMFPHGGAMMSFMPGDSARGVPQFVEVEWVAISPDMDKWWKKNISDRTDKYSAQWEEDYKKAETKIPRYTKRIDLTPILTPKLIAQVRSDAKNTQLKLIITFNNDEVEIKAIAYKWR